MLQLFEDDDVTLVEDLAFPNVEKGADSDPLVVHLRNTGETDYEDVLYMQQTEDPEQAERWVASGLAPQDELWGRVEVIGFDNDEDPSWSIDSTPEVALGAFSALLLARIPAGCAVYLRRKLHPPASASNLAWRIADTWLYSETTRPLPVPLSRLDRGIATFAGALEHYGFISGLRVTATDTPDEFVHSAPGLFQAAGAPVGSITEDHELDQDDVDADTLASGESYIAIITRSAAGAAVIKGIKGVSPTPPEVPAGQRRAATVTVNYQVGGTSVIEPEDIVDDIVYDRFYAEEGVGLQAIVHGGEAIANGSWRWSAIKRPVTLVDDSDNFIWLTAAGGLAVTADLDEPPDTAALPLWNFPVASGAIVEADVEDLRRYLGKYVILRFAGETPADVDDVLDDLLSEYPELHWEATVFRASDDGGGASGQTQVDVLINGTSAFPSSGTEDLRPAIAWDAGDADPIDRGAQHETCVIKRGDIVSVVLSEEATGGSPQRIELQLVCRLP